MHQLNPSISIAFLRIHRHSILHFCRGLKHSIRASGALTHCACNSKRTLHGVSSFFLDTWCFLLQDQCSAFFETIENILSIGTRNVFNLDRRLRNKAIVGADVPHLHIARKFHVVLVTLSVSETDWTLRTSIGSWFQIPPPATCCLEHHFNPNQPTSFLLIDRKP